MKRRTLGLMAGTSWLALSATRQRAMAQAGDSVQSLQTTLTPVGAERAGNAEGSIPAWTGGYTTIPAGWTRGKDMPDFFADEKPTVVIDSSNMSQYQDQLSVGVVHMIQKLGFSLKVYPTHRTAAFPQSVITNTAANVARAKLNSNGARLGFTGAYGGIPFPILDTDPSVAGAQILWNHNCRWAGFQQTVYAQGFVVNGGQAPVITSGNMVKYIYPYYDPAGSPEAFDGYFYKGHVYIFAPATAAGTEAIDWESINPLESPNIGWELLQGQGRVRKTPELQYDTPSIFADGLAGYDEYYGFFGALNEYDWKLIGKTEMFIPYNNNNLRFVSINEVAGNQFLNPDIVRWELHRVWVVDATLHAGERNVLAHRRFYVDEDTWTVALTDAWDGNGDLYKETMTFNLVRPEVPGTIRCYTLIYNLQTSSYTMIDGAFGDPGYNRPYDFLTPIPEGVVNANVLSSQAAY